MLKPARVWQEETFKIEKSRGCQGSFFVFSVFCVFWLSKNLFLTNFPDKLKARKANKEYRVTSLPNLEEFHRRKFEKSDKDFSIFSPHWQLRNQNRNSPRSLCEHARIFEPRSFVDELLDNGSLIKNKHKTFPSKSFSLRFLVNGFSVSTSGL